MNDLEEGRSESDGRRMLSKVSQVELLKSSIRFLHAKTNVVHEIPTAFCEVLYGQYPGERTWGLREGLGDL